MKKVEETNQESILQKATTLDHIHQLLSAVRKNNLPLMQNLITQHNLDVNYRFTEWDNRTVLHFAAANGFYDIVMSLCEEFQADWSIETNLGEIPLLLAHRFTKTDTEKYLFKKYVENVDDFSDLYESYKSVSDIHHIIENMQRQRENGRLLGELCHPLAGYSILEKAGIREDIECVENFSMSKCGRKYGKTGLRSRSDLEDLVHFALSSSEGQKAMDILNNRTEYKSLADGDDYNIDGCRVTIIWGRPVRVILTVNVTDEKLQHEMATWKAGKEVPNSRAQCMRFTVALEHQEGQINNPEAEVQLYAAYPEYALGHQGV